MHISLHGFLRRIGPVSEQISVETTTQDIAPIDNLVDSPRVTSRAHSERPYKQTRTYPYLNLMRRQLKTMLRLRRWLAQDVT